MRPHPTPRRLLLAAAATALILVAAGPAMAPLPQQAGHVDLLTEANVRIDGALAGDAAGGAVAGAGDVNGDGRADIVLGAQNADANGRANSGSVYVIFGQAAPTPIDLAALGSAGFRIDGAAANDSLGHSVAGAGDQNGDGRADVIVGAYAADNNGRADSGSAYVVFGRAEPGVVDLASPGLAGFRIDGAAAEDFAGFYADGAGDVNGDGRGDLIVGAEGADNNGRTTSGSAYVIYGRPAPADVDLAALGGTAGFRIDGGAAGDGLGNPVAGAGDVNGDGRADVALGAPRADNNGRADSGSAYVLLGRTALTPIDLAALGTAGIRIDGAAAGDLAGDAVARAGDLNGDGRADLAVSADAADNNSRADSGSVHIVLGRATLAGIDLAAPGSAGLRIDGAAAADFAGAVAGPGDVNGDGRADLVVGVGSASNNGRAGSGSTHLVLGFGAPELAYPAVSGRVGESLVVAPTTLRRTGPPSFSVAPGLPPGLSLEAATGVITGAPRAPLARRSFSVTLADLAGEVSAPLSLAVAGPAAKPRLARCQGKRATIVGTARRNMITGTRRGDVIAALGGDDLVRGRGGNDLICLGAGNDRGLGGPGRDRIDGGRGRDTLIGNAGSDRLRGQAGRDVLRGGPGADRLIGGAGRDLVRR